MKRLLGIILLIASAAIFAAAQDETPTRVADQNRTGDLPFSTSVGSDIEHVDVGSGNLIVRIPILSLKGRGMNYNFGLRYDAAYWIPGTRYTPGHPPTQVWNIEMRNYFPVSTTSLGWETNQPRLTWTNDKVVCDTNQSGDVGYFHENFIYHDGDGSKHQFPVRYGGVTCQSGSGDVEDLIGPDLEAGGLWAVIPNNGGEGYGTPNVFLADGTQVAWSTSSGSFPGGSTNGYQGNQFMLGTFVDSNGNKKVEYAGGLDTLGRTPVTQSGTNPVLYKVFDSNGNQQTYTVNYAGVTATSSFGGVSGTYGTIADFSTPRNVITSIALPNGQSYTFQYGANGFGEITHIGLPDGGTVDYHWAILLSGDRSQHYVSSRTVTVGGQSSTWTFAPVCNGSPGNAACLTKTVTVTDPANNQSVYTFGVAGVASTSGNIQSAKIYNGAATGNPLRQYSVTYQSFTDNWVADAHDMVPSAVTTTLDNGFVSQKQFDYETFNYTYSACDTSNPATCANPNGGPPPQTSNQTTRGNVTATREYDWGNGASGPLLRTTTRSYLHVSGPGAANYLARNIVDKVFQKQIANSSGTIVGQTEYDYDQTAITATSSAPQHDYTNFPSTFTTRGNASNVKRWRNTDGAWLNTVYNYDDLGNIRSVTDPGSHTTTYSYTDLFNNWDTGVVTTCIPSGDNTQSLVTLVTNALGQQLKTGYFGCTGLLNFKQDANDLAANPARYSPVIHYDLMNRPTTVQYSDGGQTTYTYLDSVNGWSPQVQKAELICNSTSSASCPSGTLTSTDFTYFDGLGRAARTAKTNGEASPNINDQVDTCFDALGHKAFQRYPYQGAGWPNNNYPCSNSSSTPGDTFAYDALGRPTTITNTDGSVVTTSYWNNWITVCDQSLPQAHCRKSMTDGLGRLVEVCEADPATGNLPTQGTCTYETDYQYDALDDLTRIDQKGGVTDSSQWHTRLFTYDSLGRLLTANNPETGTISYGYDADGNLTSKTAPNVNGGTGTITTTSTYDALHRITGKTFSNSSNTETYVYDASYGGFTSQNPIGRLVNAGNYVGGTGTNGNVGVATSYDAMGRTTTQLLCNWRVTSMPCETFSYTYNLNGSLNTEQYPSGRTIAYIYNSGQRPISALDTGNGINYVGGSSSTNATYTAWGALAGAVYGHTSAFNGITLTNAFNSRMQPQTITANTSSPSATIFSLGYQFNVGNGTTGSGSDNGNVMGITNGLTPGRSQTFTYDQLNRILTAQSSATTGNSCWGENFAYDMWANVTIRNNTKTGCNGEAAIPALLNQGRTNQYVLGYDAAGNVTANSGAAYNYDAENRMVSAVISGTTTSFDYDADGRRVQKSSGTLYWYGKDSQVLSESDLSGNLKSEYVFFNGERVARRQDGSFQSSATIQNASLSQANTLNQSCSCGPFNSGPIPNWTSGGTGPTGSWQPSTSSYYAPLPGVVAYSNGGTISQTLATGLQANTTYTLLVDVGRRLEAGNTTNYSLTLQAGSTVLATVQGSNGSIINGTFQTQALTYTSPSSPPTGNLTIVLTSYAPQVNFKNVRLNLSAAASVNYYFADKLGTSRIITDASGNPCYDADFYPFGAEQYVYLNNCSQNYKFTGKERDVETGLDYFGARYFAAGLGRFQTADMKSMTPRHLEFPQKWNKYSYVQNAPLSSIDPDGLDDYVIFRPAATSSTPSWNAAQSAVLKNPGNTFKMLNGGNATVGAWEKARTTPGTHAIFVGHTFHDMNKDGSIGKTNGITLDNGQSAGEKGLRSFTMSPPSAPGEPPTMNTQSSFGAEPQTQANSVAIFGCQSSDLSGQYTNTNFFGVDSGTDKLSSTQALDEAGAAFTTAQANGQDPTAAANAAFQQNATTGEDFTDKDGDHVKPEDH